uniref:Uncharacterized protein n=1 Tax=Sphaerodactylus townsendi TaxID=933632 RepID=A0ACB8FW70_9SAUR
MPGQTHGLNSSLEKRQALQTMEGPFSFPGAKKCKGAMDAREFMSSGMWVGLSTQRSLREPRFPPTFVCTCKRPGFLSAFKKCSPEVWRGLAAERLLLAEIN